MKNAKNQYIRNFVVALSASIGFAIVFLAFGLDNLFSSFLSTLTWLIILIDFIIFLIIVKLIFNWVDVYNIVDGVCIGVVFYCWTPIVIQPWFSDFWYSVSSSVMYFFIGFIVLSIGYFFRKRR